MSETSAMVDGLKRILKARRINYARVSEALGLSEATVKRMFSKDDFSYSDSNRYASLQK